MDPTPILPTPSIPVPSLDGVGNAISNGAQTATTIGGWFGDLAPTLTSDMGRLWFAIIAAAVIGTLALGARVWAMPFAALGGFWLGWGIYNQFWAEKPVSLFPGPGSLSDLFATAFTNPEWGAARYISLLIGLAAVLAAVVVFVGSRQKPSDAKNPAVKAVHGTKWLIRLGLRIVAALGAFAGVLLFADFVNSVFAVITA